MKARTRRAIKVIGFGWLALFVLGLLIQGVLILTSTTTPIATDEAVATTKIADTPLSTEEILAKYFSDTDILTYTNEYRATKGLVALALSETLSLSACDKADDMIAKDYWSHDAPDGTEPWGFIQNRYSRYSAAGENLAYSFPDGSSIVQYWSLSPSHEANLSGNYTEMGICTRLADFYQGKSSQPVTVAFYLLP